MAQTIDELTKVEGALERARAARVRLRQSLQSLLAFDAAFKEAKAEVETAEAGLRTADKELDDVLAETKAVRTLGGGR